MARGVIFGGLCGFVTGAVILAVASLSAPLPRSGGTTPEAVAVPPVDVPPVETLREVPPVEVPAAPVAEPETAPPPVAAVDPAPVTPAAPAEIPQPAPELSAEAPAAVVEPDRDGAPDPAPAAPQAPIAGSSARPPSALPDVSAAPDLPEIALAPAPEPAPVAEPDVDPAPEAAPDTLPETSVEATPDPAPVPEPSTGFRPVPGLASSGPVPGFAAGPRLGMDAAPAPAPAAPAGEAGSPLAMIRNAARSAPATGPVMSIVLLDSGPDTRPDPALLRDLPLPVTMAVDPATPGAAAAAAGYRAAGIEVAILAGSIPENATPADVEVAWQGFLREMPAAVAVLDAPAGRVQNARPLARQLVTLAQAGGYGLLSWDVGMNSLGQIAATDHVPEMRIYRRLDGANEEAPVIARYLDRAAFEATRADGVVVAGSARPATIAAILDWAVAQKRGLTLVPVSVQLERLLR